MPAQVRALLLVATAGALTACARAPVADPLFEAFRAPAKDARPFVRWWWNGGRVRPDEIVRQIDVMDAAGIGGVEINTIAHPGGAPEEVLARHPALDWLSPPWNEAVRVAATAARARGMTADLIVGSGWPFGGRFLAPEDQIQRVFLIKLPVNGPVVWRRTLEDILAAHEAASARGGRREARTPATARKLISLRVLPAAAAGDFTPGAEALARAAEGPFELEVPDGQHVVHAVVWELGFSHVKLGAPGADGPVVDHYDARAVRKYLDHMREALAPALGGRLGDLLRATFVDSLELDHSNWTGDLPAEFTRRRGYDLSPYLPFVLDRDDATDRSPRAETIRRARHDFYATLVELFEERFVRTYTRWAEDGGVKARIQAYGRETHPLHGSMEVHLPEGETWLWLDKGDDRGIVVESTVVNRYVASAANLTGQRLRSFEAMTNAVPVFRETLQDFKRGLDATLLAGLNHPILHGFNYTPPDAGFPGWVRFGCYLNERAPWWPMFRRFSDYAARLGVVLRGSASRARIALLAPRAQEWQHHGQLYQPFPEVHYPAYQYHLADAIAHAGWGSDFVSERVLQAASFQDGQLRYGPGAYDLLILQEVGALEVATAEALRRFAEIGGHIVFVGAAPDRVPGLHDRDARDARVREEIARARVAGGARVLDVDPPELAALAPWAGAVLQRTGVPPSVRLHPVHWIPPQERVTPGRAHVAHLHQVEETARGPRHFFFFVNAGRDEGASIEAEFPGVSGVPYRWDPETGTRSRYPARRAADGAPALSMYLPPHGSLLLVFEPTAVRDETGAEAADPAGPRPGDPPPELAAPRTLDGPWQLELRPAGGEAPLTRDAVTPGDLSLDGDPALAGFGGVAIYRMRFDWPSGLGAPAWLDLGTVHGTSEILLNGVPVASHAWGSRWALLPAAALRAGANDLEVRVATHLANYMKAQKDNPEAQRWARWFKPIPMGLVGPVRLGRPAD